MSEPNYFLDKDFEPYLNKRIELLVFFGPRGSGENDHDRCNISHEECKLIKIQPHLLTLEYEGSYPIGAIGDSDKHRKYTDVHLVPISQIVEVRINTWLEPEPDPDPEVAVAE